jgi:lysophospholipase L1-like esterase
MRVKSSLTLHGALREAVATLAKAAFAVAVFTGVVLGWHHLQTRQAMAFENSLPLPNEVVQDGCAIWFMGSSSMSRWASLQRDMRPWSTHNRAIPGATLGEISHRLLNEEKPQPPRAIVFYAGENDIAFGVPAATALQGFQTFMQDKTQKLGAVPVFFVSVKPSPSRWDNLPAQRAYNDGVRALARERDDLHFIDTASQFLVGGRPGPFYGEDGLHLNDRGYGIFAAALRRALNADLPRELVRHCHHVPQRS